MDSLTFELQIVLYFQLFLSANVRHTCRLKRGYHMYGPFCSPNAFHSKVCLETRPSPLA